MCPEAKISTELLLIGVSEDKLKFELSLTPGAKVGISTDEVGGRRFLDIYLNDPNGLVLRSKIAQVKHQIANSRGVYGLEVRISNVGEQAVKN